MKKKKACAKLFLQRSIKKAKQKTAKKKEEKTAKNKTFFHLCISELRTFPHIYSYFYNIKSRINFRPLPPQKRNNK